MGLDFARKPAGFNTVKKGREYDALSRALLQRAELVCRHLLPDGKKENGEWRVGSIQGERGKSMGVNLSTGVWKDFDGGPGGNDLISLWAERKGLSNSAAYDEAGEWLGFDTQRKKTDTPWAGAPTKTAPPTAAAAEPANEPDSLWWHRAKPTKKWEYKRDDGSVWAIVCRFDPPGGGDKVVRPWDPAREDWKWPEGVRPLFNLDDIHKTPGPVFLVEGEKCADRLNEMGYIATTMPGGSNAARVIDWTPLRGREVIRWADNDYPRTDGKKVAREIWLETTAKHLDEAGVRVVRDVTVPGAAKPDGWDCADADDDTINTLIDDALKAAPVFEGAGPFEISKWDVAMLYGGDAPEQQWLVDQLFPLGKAGLFAAQGDAGKSMLLMDLALKICGRPTGPGKIVSPTAFGHDVVQGGKVVLLLAEDDKGEVHRRLVGLDPDGGKRRAAAGKLFVVAFPDAGGAPYLVMGDERSVSATAEFEVIRNQLRAMKDLRLAVVDPLTPFVGGDLNKPHIAGAVSKTLAQLAAETGATVIATHHMSKGERKNPISSVDEARHAVRGAAAILDGLRFAYAMWPAKEAEADKVLRGLGREPEPNAMYRGAIVKANARTDRAVLPFIRSEKTGLLEAHSKLEVQEAKSQPATVTPAAVRFLWSMVQYRISRQEPAVFGPQPDTAYDYIAKGGAKKGWKPITRTDWDRIEDLAGFRRPKLEEMRAAAVAIAKGELEDEHCRVDGTLLTFNGNVFDIGTPT